MNNFVACSPKNAQLVNDFSSFSFSRSLERILLSLDLDAKKIHMYFFYLYFLSMIKNGLSFNGTELFLLIISFFLMTLMKKQVLIFLLIRKITIKNIKRKVFNFFCYRHESKVVNNNKITLTIHSVGCLISMTSFRKKSL